MTGRAHSALGVGVALSACELLGLITSSNDIGRAAICVTVAATAATLPDIDVGAAKKVYKYSIMGLIVAFVTTVLFVVCRHGGIRGIPVSIIGMVAFCALSVYGEKQPHRGFTHSFLAAGLYVASITLTTMGMQVGYRKIVIASFLFAYLSHLVIDLLNKKGEQLLFPAKDRYCLRLCSAKGIGNEMTAVCGSFISIVMLGRWFV